jgi:hypothetical protein
MIKKEITGPIIKLKKSLKLDPQNMSNNKNENNFSMDKSLRDQKKPG